ncbi:MAG TPA: VWA domain-containing protein [Candidatus Baltobacteraceae bacterium]|nr:VWA domain-containing protein [Candidatus Baltobacteraceae bacterium]
MTFKHPWLLLVAFIAAAAFAFVYSYTQRRRNEQTLRFSNLAFLIAAARPPLWPARALAALWTAGVLLVALAASGPRAMLLLPVRDGSVMLCVDTSGSMAAADVAPTRADAAQSAMRAFLAQAPSGVAAGIVSFSGDAQLVMPPSRERDRVVAALANVPAPNGATAIGDALNLSQRSLPHTGKRVIVLITDGENNAGSDPLEAAKALARDRIVLYTIGIGTNSGALVPGTLQSAGIDEQALQTYAQVTGGAYSRVENASQLREALSRLGRTTTYERSAVDLSLASALAGAALMALAFLSGIWTKSI